jgi:LuxR family maltose regulon positive regulatory protein
MPRAASFDGDVPQDQAGYRVIGFMPTNLSRPEITGELSVSPNTVNAHIRAIYAKLQVRDRSSAVRRARELRLLAAAGQTR